MPSLLLLLLVQNVVGVLVKLSGRVLESKVTVDVDQSSSLLVILPILLDGAV